MYARTVGDRELTFGVSGLLWEGSLVMVDYETESLWSHMLGEAMQGPLAGSKLEVIPSLVTDWETWKAKYPETSLGSQSRTANAYRRGNIADGAAYVIGLAVDEMARSWPIPFTARDEGSRYGVINDVLGDYRLLVLCDSKTETIVIFDRKTETQELTFLVESDQLLDEQTRSTWDPIRGVAVDGPLKGARLKAMPAFVSEASAWDVYHPHSTVFSYQDAEKHGVKTIFGL